MKIIYLEPDEEITSVVERLKALDDDEVAIVIPKRAGLLQSIINLKLLRHQSEQMKKRLSIVTTDKTGRNLASAVGLTVYQKLPENSEVIDSAVKEPKESATIPVTVKRPPSPRSKPKVSGKDISYKKGKGPIVTREVPDSPDEALAAAAEALKPKDETPSAPTKLTVPRPNLPEMPKLSMPQLKLPKVTLPKWGGGRRGTAIGLAVALLFAAFLIPTFAFAHATVTITVRTTPVKADVPMTFSARSETADAAANIIPAKTIAISRDATVQAPATGQADNGNHATGTITISNRLSSTQSLVNKTRFATPDGKIYRIQSAISVPGGGSVQATVVADDTGEEGNSPAGTALTLAAIPNSGVTAVTASAIAAPVTPGATQVSAADVEKAKIALAQKAAHEGLEAAKGKLAVGYRLDEHVVNTTVGSVSATPPVGAGATQFTLSGSVSIVYFTYEDDTLQKLLDEDIMTKTPHGSQLVPGKVAIFTAQQASGDTVSGTFRITGSAAATLSTERLKQDVAGKTRQAATAALQQDANVTAVHVSFRPPWIRHLPKNQDRIDIKFESGGLAPSPAPTRSPLPTPSPTATPVASPTPAAANGPKETAAPLL